MKTSKKRFLMFCFLASGLSMLFMSMPVMAEEEGSDDDGGEYQMMEDGTADLGNYRIKIFDPVLRKTLHVDFELIGSVEFKDQEEFMEFMKGHYNKFRELVYISVRTCTPDQLTDPTHHTFNRKITSRVNRAFGRDFLESVEPINYRLAQWSEDEGRVPIRLRPLPKKSNQSETKKAGK